MGFHTFLSDPEGALKRRLTRWQYEHVLDAVQQRLDANPNAMRQRRETVEVATTSGYLHARPNTSERAQAGRGDFSLKRTVTWNYPRGAYGASRRWPNCRGRARR